jgi:hypothetical protein
MVEKDLIKDSDGKLPGFKSMFYSYDSNNSETQINILC